MDLSMIAISILIISILLFFFGAVDRRVKVRSNVDNFPYLVRNLSNKQEAADTLARIKKRVTEFADYLNKNYPEDPRVMNIHKRLNIKSFQETPKSDSLTSYSLNKGEEISFCLRMKDNPDRIHPDNVLMFVAIHELAHVASNEVGHGKEFYENFKWLLEQAEKGEYYYKEDFNVRPFVYCGVKITHELI